MGDATDETFELEDGPADSQEPLTAGYEKGEKYDEKVGFSSEKDTTKDVRSFCLSVFNLMNAILGSGILGLAEAMKNLGVAVFYVLLLLTAGLAFHTINLLLAASKASGENSFEGLAVRSFGTAGKVATSIMIVFHCLGAMCSYVYIIKAEMPEVMKVIFNVNSTGDPHSEVAADNLPIYLQGWFLMLIVVIVIIVPLSSMKDIRFLGYSSAFGMACMLLFTFTVVAKKSSITCPLQCSVDHETAYNLSEGHVDHETAYNLSEGHHNVTGDEKEPQVCEANAANLNSKSAFAVPTMIFSFMCHASMLPIYQELRRPNPQKMRRVAGVSITLVLILYLLSASFGYFTFYNYVQSELLLTYSICDSKDPMIIVSRVMVLICVSLSTPLLHYPCRKTIITTFCPNPNQFSWFRHIGVMLATLTLTVVLVVSIPNIRDIFGIAGATSSTSLLIIFPCAFYLKLTEPKKTGSAKRIITAILLVFGLVFMLMSVSLIILDWVTSK